MSKKWTRGFELAAAAATHSTAPSERTRMGAALFNGSILVSIGFNKYFKSHPDLRRHRGDYVPFFNIHAEQAALIKRRHYDGDNNLVMYVWRESADGKAAHSKPCSMCQVLMREAGVRKVRYIDESGKWAEMKL